MGCRQVCRSRIDARADVISIRSAINRAAVVVALFYCVMSLMAAHTTLGAKMRQDTLTLLTVGGERVIMIEVAETSEQKSLGLMFRTSLADGQGMLFPYPGAQEISMWMRNTLIPLDMVFIRADGTVHRIEVRTEPLSERVIGSQGPVTAVLELAGGAAERLGLKPGDKVRHSHFRAK